MNNSLLPGTRLGRYEIGSLIGKGGMGVVFQAQDTTLHRPVALKILPAEMVDNQDRMRRFVGEARAASALNHPNILTIYEIGEAQPETDEEQSAAVIHYIAMEFIDGKTLNRLIHADKTDFNTLLNYLAQAADGLFKAHTAGIVHRDLKPDNIMVTRDGFAKILDFGLAKLIETPTDETDTRELSQPLSMPGMILGTLGYMSPEQAQAKSVDQRSDIFSFGCILYEAVTGRKPFASDSVINSLYQIINDEPAPIASLNHSAPAELQSIIRRCLMKNPNERFQSIKDVAYELRSLSRYSNETDATEIISISGDAILLDTKSAQNMSASLSQTPSEQRRQATILSADISALTLALETFDPEEINEMMNDLWTQFDKAIENGGGKVDQRLGDNFVALWGADTTREDDPERAVHTALDLQNTIGEFIKHIKLDKSLTHPLKIGISTGTIFFSTNSESGVFTKTGAAVNVANRLEQNAPFGSIFISHDTYRHIRGVFEVAEVELQVGLNSNAETPKVYAVKNAKPRAFRLGTRGIEGIETRMIGRESELEQLLDALHIVFEDGEMQAVTIVGEAGLGKSRLLYEFREQVALLPETVRVFNGRATEAMRGLPYSLVRDVFAFRFLIQDSDSLGVAREKLVNGILDLASSGEFGTGEEAEMKAYFIGQLIGLDFSASVHIRGILDDARQIRDRAFYYATQFFATVMREMPMALYLDDLHWADDESLDFFDHLAKTLTDAPLLMLCFTRPTLFERRPHWGEGAENHTRLILNPLSKRNSRSLVEDILRNVEKVPSSLRNLVVENAEGNPFYVEELIKMLIDRRVIETDAEKWRVDESRLGKTEVPPTLTGVLQARLDQLTIWERDVLQRASVIGREFWDGAVEYLGAEGDVRTALESARRKDLIYRHETSAFAGVNEYIFKHILLREVVYETVLLKTRRELHKKAAMWLIENGGESVGKYAATIAEHFEQAKETAQAANWFGRAGHQAREAFAPEAAVGFYRQALNLSKDGEAQATSVHWYEGLGEVLRVQARFSEAVEAYKTMQTTAKNLKDKLAEAKAWNGLGFAQREQGDNRTSLKSAQKAEKLAREAGDSEIAKTELARSLYRQAWAFYRLGDMTKSVALGEDALLLTAELGETGRREQARSLNLLGSAYNILGRFEQADNCYEKALTLFRQLGDKRGVGGILNNLGENADSRGDTETAVRRYQEALAIARENGERVLQIVYQSNLGGLRLKLGDFAAAENDLRQSIEMAGNVGHFTTSETYRFLAEVLLGQNKTAEALQTAQKALALAQETENQEHLGNAWRVLGIIVATLAKPVKINKKPMTAPECFAESLRIFTETRMEAERARTLHDLASYEISHSDANQK
ncbi:MAG: protein kinase [Acidobacteriota bacterium]|nr:protein kinase [Acidobacteriota bacterium]